MYFIKMKLENIFNLGSKKRIKRRRYVDTEKAETNRETIGSFQVLVTYSGDDVIFEFTTEYALDRVHTNAGYAVGKKFVESLEKI